MNFMKKVIIILIIIFIAIILGAIIIWFGASQQQKAQPAAMETRVGVVKPIGISIYMEARQQIKESLQ